MSCERLNPTLQLDGYGFFGGCDYCIEELEASISMNENGERLRQPEDPGVSLFIRGNPRPVPESWRKALSEAIAIRDAE